MPSAPPYLFCLHFSIWLSLSHPKVLSLSDASLEKITLTILAFLVSSSIIIASQHPSASVS